MDQIRCVQCGTRGLVRSEHVIAAGAAAVHYYCGRCEHTWKVPERERHDLRVNGTEPTKPEPNRS